MAEIQANSIFKTPLPWRRDTPLHAQMGALSLRYKWTAAEALPLAATPLLLKFQYTADTMDRVVGFVVSGDFDATVNSFNMLENNTGWRAHYLISAGTSILAMNNIETLPDQIDLTVWFANNTTSPAVYLAFYNFEIVPYSK